MPKKKILWIDNDERLLAPHILRLETEGYTVKQATTFTEGLKEVENNGYDLLILDIMMPVSEEEDALLHDKETEKGRKAGFVFYNEYRELLENKRIAVFVFTIREDVEIREKFLAAGLPEKNFMTKIEGADTKVFAARAKDILERR